MSKLTMRILTVGLVAMTLLAPGWCPGSAFAQTSNSSTTTAADKITELFGDAVVARGKGLEIKRSEFDAALVAVKAAASARGGKLPRSN